MGISAVRSATMTARTLCLDRACEFQSVHAHYAHNKDTPMNEVYEATINPDLERMRDSRGRRCHNCSRYLIPTDGDHTFCDDCWDQLMSHPFEGDSEGNYCAECDEPKDARIHQGFAEL
jgi:hypothetical protein